MQWSCRVGTPDGRVLEEILPGTSEAAVRAELERRGLHVFEVRPRGLGRALSVRGLARRGGKISSEKFLLFNQELAALLGAGLPLLQVLDLMLARIKEPTFKAALADVRQRVESGSELSAAFAAQGDLFPRLYPSSLMAGERTGDLEVVIRRFVRYLRLVIEARKRVVSALVYPAALIFLSFTMILVMALYVIPKFSLFYRDLEAELPALTRATLAISSGLRETWWLVAVAGFVGWLLARAWLRSPAGIEAIDGLKLRLPLLGQVFERFALTEFCRSLGTLLEGGLPLVPALEVAVSSVGNAWVRRRLAPVIAKVREGTALFAALESSGVVEDLAVDMVRVGEATGALSTMLGSVADFLDQEVEVRLQRLLALVEPALLVFMGIIIALLLVSVYLPMFSVFQAIQG